VNARDFTAADEKRLVEAATAVRANAYAAYSGYRVGAALLDDQGRIHTGCNVENASFPLGACAEANAIGAMVAAGGKRIVAIAAVGGRDQLDACTPCGGCRQNIREFSDEATRVILLNAKGAATTCAIDDLLPLSFRFPA
jgi:cytidine deaminase